MKQSSTRLLERGGSEKGRLKGLFGSGFARGVIAAAAAHLQLRLQRKDFDGAKAAVGFEIRGLISEHILTAQGVLDLGEGVGQLPALMCLQDAAAGGTRQQS